MTTLKKTILYLGVPVLAALISIPFWPEQYGDSYSEQQRKIWNEQMALSPKDNRDFMSGFPKPFYIHKNDTLEETMELKLKSSEQLRDISAPDWNTTPPVSPDLAQLPPEGMTFDELLHHAEHHQAPDAYLLLLAAPSLNDGNWYWSGGSYQSPVNQRLQFMRKWVSKANELKRPGADFLMRVLDEKEKTMNALDKIGRNQTHGAINNISGYNQFKQLLDSGDFPLYKALMTIRPDLHQTALGHQLELVLEQKARQGDIVAQRQLGEYGFLNLEAIGDSIYEEMDRPRSRFILWLSEKAEQWCPDLIEISKTADTSPTREKLDEYADWLHKAAEAGDLAAMQLWLDYGFETLKHCNEKNWNDLFTYSDILLKAGYETALPVFSVKRYRRYKSLQIIQRFYSTESLKRIDKECDQTLFKRGAESETYYAIYRNNWGKNSREYNLDLLERARRQNPGMLIGFGDYVSLMKRIKDEVVRQRFADIIRETAKEGDPLFMSTLVDMIRRGMTQEAYPEETTRLLETAWPLCRKYNVGFFYHPEGQSNSIFYHLNELVVNNLMTIYLLGQPTPENQQKAFDLAQQYLSFDDGWLHGNFIYVANFYMSLMYQKGYGTPRDPEQEKYHYERFFEDMKLNTKDKEEKINSLIEKFDYKVPK